MTTTIHHLATPNTDLKRVQQRLNAWRSQQTGRKRIPSELWDIILALLDKHPMSQVSKALRISYEQIRIQRSAKIAAISSDELDFVSVPVSSPVIAPEHPKSTHPVSIALANGVAVQCSLIIKELSPLIHGAK